MADEIGAGDYSKVVRYLRILDIDQVNELGYELGFEPPRLEEMRRRTHYNVEDFLRDMVIAWIRGQGRGMEKPTWNTLVESLKNIYQNDIAAIIAKEKCQPKESLAVITEQPRDIKGVIGQKATLKCQAKGSGKISYKWFKSTTRGGGKSLLNRSSSTSGTLIFNNLSQQDVGYYTCQVLSESAPTVVESVEVSVTVAANEHSLHHQRRDQRHYVAYVQALKTHFSIALKYIKMVMLGPPRSGKSSLKKRLLGEITNLMLGAPIAGHVDAYQLAKNHDPQATCTVRMPCNGTLDAYQLALVPSKFNPNRNLPSTGTVDSQGVVVYLSDDKTKYTTAQIHMGSKRNTWASVDTRGQVQSNNMGLDEEMHLLYDFIIEGINLEDTAESADRDKLIKKEDDGTPKGPGLIEEDDPFEISESELKEIDRAFNAFEKVLQTSTGQQRLKALLEKTILLNMVDTGGQPAFIEMLPMLTIGPALYLIFLRLDQELKQVYNIHYVSEDHQKVSLGESSCTFEEVLFQVLSSIQCFRQYALPNSRIQKHVSELTQAAMIVGTYKDEVKGSDEEVSTHIKNMDDALKKNLRITGTDVISAHESLLRYAEANQKQLMLVVNNMTGKKEEVKNIRKCLEDIILNEFSTPEIPATWLMFGVFIQRMKKTTISLSQCKEIGRRLHMDFPDVEDAIWFLHHYVGILLHYPDLPEMKDEVICDPQVVFDSVTELIINSFELKRNIALEKFRCTGKFRQSEIGILTSKRLKILGLPKLVKLLEHLGIIARISSPTTSAQLQTARPTAAATPSSQSSADDSETAFFMPAILPSAPKDSLNVFESPNDPVPLVIRFKTGYVPVGVFCATIASLVAREIKLGWNLQHSIQDQGYALYKDRVTFRVCVKSGSYNVTLISKPTRYEVYVTLCPRSKPSGPPYDVCEHVLQIVCKTLDDVIFKVSHKRLIASPLDLSKEVESEYELGFQCPLPPSCSHPNDEHVALFRPFSGSRQAGQTALELLCGYSTNATNLLCLCGNTNINLKDLASQATSSQSGHKSEDLSANLPDLDSYKKYTAWIGPDYNIEPNPEEVFMEKLKQCKLNERDRNTLEGEGITSDELLLMLDSQAVENLKKKLTIVGGPLLKKYLDTLHAQSRSVDLGLPGPPAAPNPPSLPFQKDQSIPHLTDFRSVTPLSISGLDTSAYGIWRLKDIHDRLNGEGIVIAIIDNGVNYAHDAFKAAEPLSKEESQRRLGGKRYLPTGETSNKWGAPKSGDTASHGTMAAFVAGGVPFGDVKTGGVAPKSTLWICSVGKDYDEDSIINALEDLIKIKNSENPEWKKFSPDIVSMSFGLEYIPGDVKQKKMAEHIQTLIAKGVVFVAAAGNYGSSQGGLQFPACESGVIRVGAHDEKGVKMDINPPEHLHCYAPGNAVLHPHHASTKELLSSSGTSCAAPAIAGLIALLLQFSKTYETDQTKKEMYRKFRNLEQFFVRHVKPPSNIVLDPVTFLKSKLVEYDYKQLRGQLNN